MPRPSPPTYNKILSVLVKARMVNVKVILVENTDSNLNLVRIVENKPKDLQQKLNTLFLHMIEPIFGLLLSIFTKLTLESFLLIKITLTFAIFDECVNFLTCVRLFHFFLFLTNLSHAYLHPFIKAKINQLHHNS